MGHLGCGVVSDINASAVHVPAADQLALHQNTGHAQRSAVHSWHAQLQVTKQCTLGSVIFVNENENEIGEKRENNEFVNEN